MASKLKYQRPGSSARVYDYENGDLDNSDNRSKIPRLPKRTYSLEGQCTTFNRARSSSRQKSSITSMIPRPEWKKYYQKSSAPESPHQRRHKLKVEKNKLNDLKSGEGAEPEEKTKKKVSKASQSRTNLSNAALETKIREDFINFKKNVLRIPEYWTDAGTTVTNILKNAINIVAKQYPSADVESFENEIQNILKATEVVKQEILSKTENIIEQANRLYVEGGAEGEPSEEELMRIKMKMEELQQEVNLRENMLGDLLNCDKQMNQLGDMEKTLKVKAEKESKKSSKSDGRCSRQSDGRRSVTGSPIARRREKSLLQSCGDSHRETFAVGRSKDKGITLEDKANQTINFWTAELHKREEDIKMLNKLILDLHQVCKDHISKFKSFNLQIKLRGICNKAQNVSVCKEIQNLNDEKIQLTERNHRLQFYNKDLENAIKQKDLDLQQKDRLITQQKKLLHVRDELIEMLKSRCNIEEIDEV